MENFLRKLYSNFAELTRLYALPVTLASCIVVWAFAHYNLNFSYFNFILLVFALCCVHLGGNLFDDYTDVKNKLKTVDSLANVSFERYTLKANLILNKTFSFKEVEAIIGVLFSIAVLIGIYFAYVSTPFVLLFGMLGGILCIFYPVSAKYYLSEVTIGLIYGPLMVNGGYLALTGEMNYGLFLCSIAIFFSTIVLQHTDNIMDWEHDVKEGKKTLSILSKSKEKAIDLLKIIICFSYFTITASVLSGEINPNSLYVFLTLPIAVKLTDSLYDYINIKDVVFVRKWYWGPFENWKKIEENKIDFFMYRMYLGRNYLLFFAIFLAIGTIV